MPGQRVNISVTGYPYMEFGFLTGKVMSVSLLADDESAYTAHHKPAARLMHFLW